MIMIKNFSGKNESGMLSLKKITPQSLFGSFQLVVKFSRKSKLIELIIRLALL
jgi:hypothetical protein